MPSFGEQLKEERESRGTTIDQIAAASGIGRDYLEALERDEIRSLPGPAFGKLYIRAYAEVLGFDPQPWIEAYDRAQRVAAGLSEAPAPAERSRARPVAEALARWKAERISTDGSLEPAADAPPAEAEKPSEAEPLVVALNTSEPAARRRVAPVLLVGAVAVSTLIVVAVYVATRDSHVRPPLVAPVSESLVPVMTPAASEQPQTPPPQSSPQPPPAKKAPAARAPGTSAELGVAESGVGRRIVNLRLEGESDRFPEGTRVCFATRITGGQRGEIIRHVWLYEGRIEQSISLRLGGPDWRTHSNKTIGRSGAWTVEARDGNGRVLARAEFTCEPAGR